MAGRAPRSAVALLVLTWGCATAPARSGTVAQTDKELRPVVAKLAQRAEALLRRQDEMVWRHWTQGAALELGKTYEGEEDLFTPASIRAIDALRQVIVSASPPELAAAVGPPTGAAREIRSLTYLHSHFVGEYLSRELLEHSEAIANLHASLTFTHEGQEHPYRDLDRLLANERALPRRRALYAAASPAVQRLTHSVRRRQERTSALLAGLGYASTAAYAAELRQANLERLRYVAEEVLQRTQAAYVQLIGQLSDRELGAPLAILKRADVPRLFGPVAMDGYFAREELLPRLHETLAGLGLELEDLPGLKLDAAVSPKKNPRTLALAVTVPSDIRVSVKPAAGLREQALLFHEVAHALHFALSSEKSFSLAKLGNPTLGETYATLFEDLLVDPIWLEQHAKVSGPKLAEYLKASAAHRLYQVRRQAGSLVYQRALDRQEAADEQAIYRDVMGRTYGVEITAEDQERFVLDQDELYASADALRASLLAAQLQAQLKLRFGPLWWRDPNAGKFLRTLWGSGNAMTPSELALQIGEKEVRPDALLSHLSSSLGLPFRGAASAGGSPGTGRP